MQRHGLDRQAAMRPRLARASFALLSVLAWTSCGADGDDAAAGPCAPVEIAIDGVPEVENPFDPAQADVTVTFTGPNGSSVVTPAFYWRGYERSLVGGFEHLTPTGERQWRARLTPPRAGTWRWTASVRSAGRAAGEGAEGSFACQPDPTARGVIRRSTADPRFLAWEDGTPHVSIGENLCWYDGRGTFAYDDWLDKLAVHGATWIRLWMPSWAFGLEWIRRGPDGTVIETTLGNYDARLDRAWQLDHVIEAARRRGMVVMLAIQNHGAFSLTANSEWADNPYNAANGGPLERPHELYTSAEGRRLFERRLRYLVARWGYAPNLIWEFWNEVDLADAAPMADVIQWHEAMGAVLRDLDPYDHLITTSVALQLGPEGLNPLWVPLWNLPVIDLVQIHLYGLGRLFPVDFTTVVPLLTRQLAAATGKPVLLGEAGVDFRGPAETLDADPEHRGLHELIWSGLFAGGLGTGMTWWWDNVIDPENQYGQLDGIVRLTRGVAWDREDFALSAERVSIEPAGGAVRVLPLLGRDTVLLWVRSAAHVWFEPDLTPVAGVTIEIRGLAPGRWEAHWLEPVSGATVAGETIAVSGGAARLAMPKFSGEIALRLDRS